MLRHLFGCFCHISIVGDVGCGCVKPGAHEVNPDARLGTQQKVSGHEPNLRKLLIQVFVDDRRFVDYTIAVDEHGHLAVGILL
jgi:hypothetical protein